jgi:hypothetical protein
VVEDEVVEEEEEERRRRSMIRVRSQLCFKGK